MHVCIDRVKYDPNSDYNVLCNDCNVYSKFKQQSTFVMSMECVIKVKNTMYFCNYSVV